MNLIKRVISMAICVIILFLSPVSVYFSANNISTVHASGEIVVEGASIAWEWLLAWLASVGLTAAAVENKDALMASYKEYLDAQIDTELTIGETVRDKCIEVYDSASNAVSSIPWDDYYNSLGNFHDTAVDNLTGIYMKVCPELLDSFESFIDSIISGDTYVEGISDVIEEQAFTGYDSLIDADEKYFGDAYSTTVQNSTITNSHYYIRNSLNPCFVRYQSGTQYDTYWFCVYNASSQTAMALSILNEYTSSNGSSGSYSSNSASVWHSSGVTSSFSTNMPIFSSDGEAIAAFEANDFTTALNYAVSMYDTITDNNDLPLWDVEELWQRVARAVDVIDSIGAYGDGVAVGTKDWTDDLPWVDVGALSEWDDVIDRTLEGILSGVIDLPLDIPDNPTYVDVWEDVIDKTWDDVITVDPTKTDDSDIPGNPDITDNPDIPIDQPVSEVIELDTTLPSMPETFLPLAEQMKIKFPFSIPWDIRYLFDKLSSQGREPPRWVLPFVIESIGLKGELVIDLKNFEPVSKISRLFLTLLFCLGLINMTIKIVGMRKEE